MPAAASSSWSDKSFDHFGARVSPPHQLVDVHVGHTDQSRDDHHRQSVRHRRHPLDGAAVHAFVPQRSAVSPTNDSSALMRLAANCGTNNFRCAAWAGSSAVASAWMSPPSSPIGNAPHLAVLVRHRGGEVRREILRPGDDLIDRVPAAHRVEARSRRPDEPAPQRACVRTADTGPERIGRRTTSRPRWPSRTRIRSRLIGRGRLRQRFGGKVEKRRSQPIWLAVSQRGPDLQKVVRILVRSVSA